MSWRKELMIREWGKSRIDLSHYLFSLLLEVWEPTAIVVYKQIVSIILEKSNSKLCNGSVTGSLLHSSIMCLRGPSTAQTKKRRFDSIGNRSYRLRFRQEANGNHNGSILLWSSFHYYPGPSLPDWPRHKEYLKLVIIMHRLCLNNSIALAAIDREYSTIIITDRGWSKWVLRIRDICPRSTHVHVTISCDEC